MKPSEIVAKVTDWVTTMNPKYQIVTGLVALFVVLALLEMAGVL